MHACYKLLSLFNNAQAQPIARLKLKPPIAFWENKNNIATTLSMEDGTSNIFCHPSHKGPMAYSQLKILA